MLIGKLQYSKLTRVFPNLFLKAALVVGLEMHGDVFRGYLLPTEKKAFRYEKKSTRNINLPQ